MAQWAAQERRLPSDSPEPGRYRPERTPYIVDPMNSFMDRALEIVLFCCAAQMGKTELVFAAIGKIMTDGPRVPCLYVGPTEKQVRSVSKQRVGQMIRSTPALDELHMKGRTWDSIAEKFFAGGTRLGFAHAGSPTELASHPCGCVLVDEYSRMEANAEGDPMLLARARTKNFPNGKVGVFSTPTVRGLCPTWNWFLEGTREVWCWKCPHCHSWFAPRRELLRWPENATPSEARLAAYVACDQCGGEIRTQDRPTLPGKYIPYDIDDDWRWTPRVDNPPNTVRSFWASGLCSPWMTFGEIAENLLRAMTKGDASLQTVVNTDLGEPFELAGDAPAWNEIMEHCLPYKLNEDPPHGVQIVTMGVDVQKRGLYYVIRGFGYGGASWLLDRGVLHGETAYKTVWDRLTEIINNEDRPFLVQRCFIDSGYNPGATFARPQKTIYSYSNRFHHVFATKGHDRIDARDLSAQKKDIGQYGRSLKDLNKQLWHVNTHIYKSLIYDMIRMPPGSTEAFFVPDGIDEEYCRQVTSEQLVIDERKMRWIPHYRHNHYLDCEVLALAAAYSVGLEGLEPLPKDPSAKRQKKRFSRQTDMSPREL